MIRLRQVALVARDLDTAEVAIEDALGATVCFRDPGVAEFGLRNALFTIGDQFLEVVSPTTAGTTAGRLLDRRGDGGYMAIFQVDALDSVQRRLDEENVRVVFDARGDGIRGLHIHPKDVPGAIVSIDACDEPADWPWAGTRWRDQPSAEVSAITGITVAVDDPITACARWCAALGLEHEPASAVLTTDDATIRFLGAEDGRFGITAIEFRAAPNGAGTLPASVLGVDVSLGDS